MPDGSGFDPFAAAGMVKDAAGAYVPSAAAPVSSGTTVDLAGNPVSLPANLPPVNLPPISAPTPAPANDQTVIDVSGARSVTPPATPELDAVMARLRNETQPQQQTAGDIFTHGLTGGAGQTAAPATPEAKPVAAPAEPNPFAAAGLVQLPDGSWTSKENAAQAPVTPPSGPPGDVKNEPWYASLIDAARSADKTFHGATDSAVHYATLGLDSVLDPLPNAIVRWMKGTPFSEAYDQAKEETTKERKEYEANHPLAAAGVGLLAGAPALGAVSPLFGTAKAGATTIAKAVNYARNAAAGSVVGGGTGFSMSDGDLKQRIEAAKEGAEWGGGIQAAVPAIAPIARAISRTAQTVFRPTANVDPLAGKALLQRAGTPAAPATAPPPMQTAPIPNMPLDLGQASNNPGLAAHVRQVNQAEPIGANKVRAGQNAAVEAAATEAQPGGVQLASGRVHSTDASSAIVNAMGDTYEVLRTEADRLWQDPLIANKVPDIAELQRAVADAIDQMPPRWRNALDRNGDVRGAINDLNNLPADATLADVNAVRSDILEASRSLPFNERFARRAADQTAQALLDAIEANPELTNDPASWAAYVKARKFTRDMWTALEKPQFQAMLQAAGANRKGIDPATVARRMFNFAAGSEKTPGAVANITALLANVEQEWRALGNANFDPAIARAARDTLAQGTRDFIINSMLEAAQSNTRDVAGEPNALMNALSKWIDKNQGWMSRSGLFGTDQQNLLEAIKQAAIMAGRTENLRGGPGSPTYELLKGESFLNVFMGPFLGRGITTVGGMAIGAGLAALFGEAGIGSLIGAEAGGGAAGYGLQSLLRRIYEAPRQLVLSKLQEAARDPVLAHDLMQKASQAGNFDPKTKAFLRSFFSALPAQSANLAAPGSDGQGPSAGQAGSPPFPTPPQPPPERRSEIDGNPWAGNDPFARAVPTLADAADLAARKWAEARESGRQAGMETPGGWPTEKAINEALHAYGEGLLTGSIGPEFKGIRAFHGTPHSFDKFDISKIGSGEGAQVYGHGLYFAEREGIAKDYRDKLSHHSDVDFMLDGIGYHQDEIDAVSHPKGGEPDAYKPISYMMGNKFNKAAARADLVRDLDAPWSWNKTYSDAAIKGRLDTFGSPSGPSDIAAYRAQLQAEELEEKEGAKRALAWFDANADRIQAPPDPSPGHMYEVKINADPAHMLHWDKKLSEQTPEVQQKLRDLGVQVPSDLYKVRPVEGGWVVDSAKQSGSTYVNGTWQISSKESGKLRVFPTQEAAQQAADATAEMTGHNPTGEALYHKLGYGALKEGGIPGVSYFDAASRGGSQNARNLAANADALAQAQKQLAEVHEEITRNRDNPGLLPRFFERREQDIKEYEATIKSLEQERAKLLEAQKTTHNHVVFDDATIEIIRKYGIAGLMAMGTAAAATHRQEQ